MAQPIWNTAAGNIGTFPSLILFNYQLSASAVLPAVDVVYNIISGHLPNGVTMNEYGLISGTPSAVETNTTYTFVVRATDNYQNIRDRTFSLNVSGVTTPVFTTPAGSILETLDSTWVELPIEWSTADSDDTVVISLIQGRLPPGLEINEHGLIRGYPKPPIINVNLPAVTGMAIAIQDNKIICYSTSGFQVGRPIIFSGNVIGGVEAGKTYYINQIIDSTSFYVSATANGTICTFNDDAGFMPINIPGVAVGQPTIQTFDFTLRLTSKLGTNTQFYSITVVNQNTPASASGPGRPKNTRNPTLLNTRPMTYDIESDPVDYRYYLLPKTGGGTTYNPATPAYIGTITSDNFFAFKLLGYDFDGNSIQYVYSDLPLGLVGDPNTGWITGTPMINPGLNIYNFSAYVCKTANPAIQSPSITFSFKIVNELNGDIFWDTPSNLGTILNGTVSELFVKANSDVPLKYELVSGSLPPNLSLLTNTGEISGVVAFQPTDSYLYEGSSTDFTFTIRAYSDDYPVASDRTFTLSVYQEFNQPMDTLYIKCTPSISDRVLLASLLDNQELIPSDYLYRPNDPYFGKAKSVIYEHAYGIFASDFDQYVAAITKNHYWRNITLGEIQTAIARDENTGEIVYEVVYSRVIDNLVNYNEVDQYDVESQSNILTPEGESVAKEIYWPRDIPLELGPWYTSETDIFASYIGKNSPPPEYYTSLTPGDARLVYPNSLPNMRQQVGDVLGQVNNYKILPRWMTSQQLDGSTLGFTPAWVICYTKPGYANTVKENITNNWVNIPNQKINTLNTINFTIDRFTVDKSTTFNYDNNLSPSTWTSLPSASPTPEPKDSRDFYVLFPRKTILPNKTQY